MNKFYPKVHKYIYTVTRHIKGYPSTSCGVYTTKEAAKKKADERISKLPRVTPWYIQINKSPVDNAINSVNISMIMYRIDWDGIHFLGKYPSYWNK